MQPPSPNAAICGRSEMALFVRLFAQNVTAHGDPQDGLVSIPYHLSSDLLERSLI